ncbi:MAG: recombinase family protein [Candidatus Woesearchaeota archaeon]
MIKKPSLKKQKAAIYVRVSTEEQAREGYSLGAQETALKDYIGMMGYDLFKVYRDEGKSAKDIQHRPALQQLLKDAEKKLFKAIFVYKLDRFSRSLKDLILTIELLKKQDIDFISLQDKIETASASGKLMFHIISSFAEFERDIISERTRFGMVEKAKEGGIVSKAPLGYTIQDGRFVVDEEKKKVVQDMFKEFIETDRSLNSISREHNLTVSGLIKVLRNRAYIGEVKFKENYTGIHETLIDKKIFEEAQSKLNKNSHNRENLRYTNLLKRLNPKWDNEALERLASSLTTKEVLCIQRDVSVEKLRDEELKHISEPYTLQKYAATQLLLEEGFGEDEISYDRMFVNADKTDVYANNMERRVYIDCTPINMHKLLEYLNEGIEYWLILGDADTSKMIKCYLFTKSES